MPERIFPEDEVVLREDPSITAVVEQTWQDADLTALSPRDFLYHKEFEAHRVLDSLESSQLRKGIVIIRFVNPPLGLAVCKEEDLILRDRGLCVGDIVKRPGSFEQSGYVIKTSLECDCRPIYPDLPHSGSEPWTHKPEDNEIRVSSEDLELQGFAHGKVIIYKGWVGEVVDITEEVAVRMSDGGVVRIYNIDDLEFNDIQAILPPPANRSRLAGMSLAQAARFVHQRWLENPDSARRRPLETVHTGLLVHAKKSVFRLGHWIIGKYSPSIPPRGHVVEVTVTSMEVDWLTCDPFLTHHSAQPPRPNSLIEFHELNNVVVYNRNNLTELTSSSRNYGARQSQDIVAGDPVAFRDVAGAAVKHSHSGINRNAGGGFRRIPRAMTNGYDINTLSVVGTRQHVIVHWQDGSASDHDSTDLYPDLNVDEHDYFVGELCSMKSAETSVDGLITLKKVGVIQAVDARERLLRVRWYSSANVTLIVGDHSEMLSESTLGDLEQEVHEVSVYETTSYPALVKRRGDLVVVRPDGKDRGDLIAETVNGAKPLEARMSPNDIRWFGEVVDLGTDGLITVRLGALDNVEDIRVPANQIYTVLGGDDDDDGDGFFGDEDEDSFSDDDDYDSVADTNSILANIDRNPSSISSDATLDSSTDSENGNKRNKTKKKRKAVVLEEQVLYDGEIPPDANDDDAWMTDDSDEESTEEEMPDAPASTLAAPGNADTLPQSPPITQHNPDAMVLDSSEDSPQIASSSLDKNYADYSFSHFPSSPAQFVVCDGSVPSDHHYSDRSVPLTGTLLRRIRKEHRILQSSLPPGIFVRTWTDSLHAMRILIIGPRNTPYELAPFVLDVHFSADYPYSPPKVFFHSWTYGVGRVNPNLYEDGKVCLSVLGTWPHDQRNEGWNKDKSSLLQVLVSLMGLVLVGNPYYNEAGFEALVGTEETQFASKTYSQKAYCMSKGFLEHALKKPVKDLEDVIGWLYTNKQGPQLLALTVKESRHVLENSVKEMDNDTFVGAFSAKLKLSTGAQILLKRHLEPLEKRLTDLE